MKTAVCVRPALPNDAKIILAFLDALAAFEKAPGAIRMTEASLLKDCFGQPRRFGVLLAERDRAPCGMLTHYFAYSSWQAAPSLVVHDLFVAPEHRGSGAGRALLAAAARLALAQGCCRLDVNVLTWNENARRFYQRAGFVALPDWQPFRLDHSAMDRLAKDPA